MGAGLIVAEVKHHVAIVGTVKPGAAYRSRITLYRATAEGQPTAGSDALIAMWVRPALVLQCHEEGGLSDLDTRPALLAWAREATGPSCTPARTWTEEQIRAAWYRAEETGRPARERPREPDDLANGWEHVRAALHGEAV